jgi:carbonic anhydrase
MNNFDAYAFSKQPGYHEPTVRKKFAKAVPLRTVVIYCYDPRAVGIPAAVARQFGEVYPGKIISDAQGAKVASTTTLFEIVVAGGRAVDALRSITVAQHLFGLKNIVVVHHTYCGATSFTADGIIAACEHEHQSDISDLYQRESICISDYVSSLKHDVQLVRKSIGTPKHVNIYGCVYDINTDELSPVVEDNSPSPALAGGQQGGARKAGATEAVIAEAAVVAASLRSGAVITQATHALVKEVQNAD